ncbi:MAG: DNA polymerase III subunit gamma/tau [Bacillota bacterium]
MRRGDTSLMAYQALYRAWRPKTFAEIVGQEHVTRTLQNAILTHRLGHAYLFCGPRGTGKTSTAKVLAKACNCPARQGAEPCNACPLCAAVNDGVAVDVLEIDAASNRGIDEARELRERVKLRPAVARYKVYIIDEVHMLSHDAFNALLKTLEEPPPHVLFVLATTEIQKVPLTIVSRCQRFDFRRLGRREIVRRLEEVAAGTGLEVEAGVLELIARVSEGSLRDALSILDQVATLGDGRVTLAAAHDALGTVSHEVLAKLVLHLVAGEAAAALRLLHGVEAGGKDVRLFAREFADFLRSLLLWQVEGKAPAWTPEVPVLLELLTAFAAAEQEVRSCYRASLPLELAAVRFAYGRREARGVAAPREEVTLDGITRAWQEVLAAYRKERPAAAGALARATPVRLEGRQLFLRFQDEFSARNLMRPENRAALEETLARSFGGRWEISMA